MAITSVSGPDVMNTTYSPEPIRQQPAPEPAPERERPREEGKGGSVDSYA